MIMVAALVSSGGATSCLARMPPVAAPQRLAPQIVFDFLERTGSAGQDAAARRLRACEIL